MQPKIKYLPQSRLHFIADAKGNRKKANKERHAFLFPVKAMSNVYRALFLKRLKALISSGKVKNSMSEQQWNVLKERLYKKDWIVYCKRPFGGPQQVMEYLHTQTTTCLIDFSAKTNCY